MNTARLFRNTVIWVVIASLLNAVGSLLYLYDSVWWYSWIVHISAGIGMGFFWLYLMRRFDVVYNLKYAVAASLFVALVWEVLEFVLRVSRYDTLLYRLDNAVDVIVAVLATVAVYWFVVNKTEVPDDAEKDK